MHLTGLTVVLLAVLGSCVPRGAAWLTVLKDCPANCTQRGNCNGETGQCECPYGWAGPACETLVLPACRTTLAPPGLGGYVPLLMKPSMPRSCACMHQAQEALCYTHPVRGKLCDHKWLYSRDMVCFNRTSVPWEQHTSDLPDPDETGVEWYRPWTWDTWRQLDTRPALTSYGRLALLPLRHCPDRCSERGWCAGTAQAPECVCSKGWAGRRCQEPDWVWSCRSRCSGRGRCLGGWCHCLSGYWGPSCERHRAYAPDPNRAEEVADRGFSRTAVKIYVYSLPWQVSWPETEYFDRRSYGAWQEWEDQLRADRETYTQNPYEANLFYVPADVYMYSTNIATPSPHLRKVLSWLEQHSPFWRRHSGKDHVVAIPGDKGACWLGGEALLQAPIKLAHYGLQVHESQRKVMPTIDKVNVSGSPAAQYMCHSETKDVVLPPLWAPRTPPEPALKLDRATGLVIDTHPHRPYLLHFAGSIKEQWRDYAGGARYELFTHLLNTSTRDPGLSYGGSCEEAGYSAVYCFSPAGSGFGNRIKYYMLQGCIPVTVQSHVHQPYDDVLPYEAFSLRVPHQDVRHLMHILRSIPPATTDRLRRGVARYWRAFTWRSGSGGPNGTSHGNAYTWSLRSLHRKLHNLWAEHY